MCYKALINKTLSYIYWQINFMFLNSHFSYILEQKFKFLVNLGFNQILKKKILKFIMFKIHFCIVIVSSVLATFNLIKNLSVLILY